MHARQPLPRLWMATDERQGDGLIPALRRLPRGSGIVFRHYSLPEADRLGLFEEVRSVSRRRNQLLFLAGPAELAIAWGADGSHGRGRGEGLRSAPVHDLREIRDAEQDGADFLFLSPLFATRSHPGARPLGLATFARLVRRTPLPVIALGGMNRIRARRAERAGAYGWAAIDAWTVRT